MSEPRPAQNSRGSRPPPGEAPKGRSQRLYIYWAIALAALIALGLFCWLIVAPVLRVRAVVLGYPYYGSIDSPRPPSYRRAMERLGGTGAAVGKLALYLRLPRRLAPRRGTAAALLATCGRRALPALLDLLEDRDPLVRQGAVRALGEIGDRRAAAPVARLLKDPFLFARLEAADALGRIGGAETVGPLEAALGDEDRVVRQSATWALGRTGGRRAVPALTAALLDEEEYVRAVAVRALGEIGGAEAVSAIEAALMDRSDMVHRFALDALKEAQAGEKKGREAR